MQSRQWAFFLFSVVGFCVHAIPQSGAPVFYADELDVILASTQTPSPAAQLIAEAEKAHNRGDQATLRAKAERALKEAIQRDPRLVDHARFWLAEAHMMEAKKNTSGKKWKFALDEAKNAIRAIESISIDVPFTSREKDMQLQLVRAELCLARAHLESERSKSIAELDRALSRLSLAGKLITLGSEAIETFVRACKPVADQGTCAIWLTRLREVFPEGSYEFIQLSQLGLPKAPSANANSTDRLIKGYPAPDRDAQAIEPAIASVLNEEWANAKSLLEAFLQTYPQSKERFRALYWLGRLSARDGQQDQATKAYQEILIQAPFSWYAILAAEALGRRLDASLDARVPAVYVTSEGAAPKERFLLSRAQELRAAGALKSAAIDLDEVKPRPSMSEGTLIYLATLNADVGNTLQSFRYITELLQRGSGPIKSSHGMRLIFPKLYFSTVNRSAQEQGLDPLLVLSLIKQESAFDRLAVSSSGASGLMQLMPRTAVDTDGMIVQAKLTEPETNIRVGTTYFARVLRQFQGNAALALAGYNAGPSRAEAWARAAKAHWSIAEFVESIPYPETRGYVSSIVRNHFWYSHLLSTEPWAGAEAFYRKTP